MDQTTSLQDSNTRSTIKFNCFVQDNGPEIQLYLKSINGTNQVTGETKSFDCRFQDYLPSGWVESGTSDTFAKVNAKPEYLQKQPHYAIIMDDMKLAVVYNDKVKLKIQQKYPNSDIQKLVVIKTTDGMEMLKLNTIVQIVGVLEYSTFSDWDDELDLLYYLPTIHCMEFREMSVSQLITSQTIVDSMQTNGVDQISKQLKETSIDSKFNRNDLLKLFKNSLGGDLLAAEYLICQLLHSSTKRLGGIPTSKFNLNIYGKQLNIERLTHTLHQVWPLVSGAEFSIERLNNSNMQPVQGEMGLKMGDLQKPNQTMFVIDESKMSEGVLNSTGIDNIKAVQCCIDYQTVEYRIPYGQFETETNYNFLMVGPEPSILQVLQF